MENPNASAFPPPCTASTCDRMFYIYHEKNLRAYAGTVRNSQEFTRSCCRFSQVLVLRTLFKLALNFLTFTALHWLTFLFRFSITYFIIYDKIMKVHTRSVEFLKNHILNGA